MSTHITAAKKIVEDSINFDLFPKINKGNKLLKFGPNDRFSERQVFENIQIMKAIQMTDEAVQEYLADRGMFFKEKLFVDPVEQAKKMQDVMGQPGMDNGVQNSKEKDNFVSRQRTTDAGSGNKKQDQVTTRQDQIHKVK
jgi:hypothetical protein